MHLHVLSSLWSFGRSFFPGDMDTAAMILEVAKIVFASILAVGSIAALIPQLVNLVRYKTTVGISFMTLLLGNISSFCTAVNVIILNMTGVHQCIAGQKYAYECTQMSLLLVQIVALWAMYLLNLIAYMAFFRWTDNRDYTLEMYSRALYLEHSRGSSTRHRPKKVFTNMYNEVIQDDREDEIEELISFLANRMMQRKSRQEKPDVDEDSVSEIDTREDQPLVQPSGQTTTTRATYHIISFVFVAYLAFVLFTGGVAGFFLPVFGHLSPVSLLFASSMGIVSSALTFLQWTPQILRTFRNKGAGNFSIVMMIIMTPGSFVILGYLIFVAKQSFSTWLSYLCSGIQQVVLLALLILYETRAKLYRKIESLGPQTGGSNNRREDVRHSDHKDESPVDNSPYSLQTDM